MPSVTAGTGAGASGVLLERAAELSMLAERLAAVGRGSGGQVLLVSGEAGVGKTTLLRRFCEQRGRSARILWGAGDPLFTPSPLGPLLAVAEESGGELRAVVERGAMPYAVVAALAHELSARAPTVFVLEDLHWADEATLDVLRLLARRVETVPALVVASYRDDQLDRAHPLRVMLGELATSRSVGRIKLGRLSPGSRPASSRCCPCSAATCATPTSPPACTSPGRRWTTTSRRSWPSPASLRGAKPRGSRRSGGSATQAGSRRAKLRTPPRGMGRSPPRRPGGCATAG